jgi:serine/threonine-protein kinase
MKVVCANCGMEYQIGDAYAGQAYHCHLCRHPIEPCDARKPCGKSDTKHIYLVCSFCSHNFGVPISLQSGSVRCPSCGKDVSLAVAGDTLAMDATDTFAPLLGTVEETAGNQFLPAVNDEPLDSRLHIGKYRLDNIIGHTPLGVIYAGHQSVLQRDVAIYLLADELAGTDAQDVFLQEARRAAGLVHPHIARVYDVDSLDDKHFMVSELVQGESLEQRIQDGKLLTVDEVAHVGMQVADALAAAHAADFVHANVSPANILFDGKGDARVLHFGIARALASQKAGAGEGNVRLLLAPEQHLGLPIDTRTDIFGLGVTLYIALTGALPYNALEIQQIVQRKSVPRPPDIKHLCPDLPKPLAQLMRTMLQIRADDRLQSATAVVEVFDNYLHGHLEEEEPEEELFLAASAHKRRYRRFRTDMDVAIETVALADAEKQEYFSKIGNLSENGAFILTDNPLPERSFVNMSFRLENSNTKVHVLGLVRWVDTTPGQMGMGIQFLEVSTQDRNNINNYVDQRSATDVLNSLTSTHLHKAALKTLVNHWGRSLSISRLMQGTGVGRGMFEGVLQDFVAAGLVRVDGDEIFSLQPESDALCDAVLNSLRGVR